MTAGAPGPAATLGPAEARDAVAAVAAACSGHVGLAARHPGTGEELARHPGAVIQTASTVKVAEYAEVMRRCRLGLVDREIVLDHKVSAPPRPAIPDPPAVPPADRPLATATPAVLGRPGAIVLARWWAGPGPVPLRPGWLPGPRRAVPGGRGCR